MGWQYQPEWNPQNTEWGARHHDDWHAAMEEDWQARWYSLAEAMDDKHW